MKVYLASPFFNDNETKYYNQIINKIRSQENIDLFVPREHTIPNAWDLSNRVWAENVFAVDLLALQKADVVVVLNWGLYSDSGTAWECGYAYAMNKTIINIVLGEIDEPYSIMMLNGGNHTMTFADFIHFGIDRTLNENIDFIAEFEQK